MGVMFMYGVILFIAVVGSIYVIVEDRKASREPDELNTSD